MKQQTKKQRLDDLLVALGLASDHRQATAMVLAGQVVVNNHRIDKPGTPVSTDADLRIKNVKKYVSRAGLKLESGVSALKLNALFPKAIVLDVGSSTGGFTDFALQANARQCICVDVGTNQLAWKIRSDERVVVHENTDIRSLATNIPVGWPPVDLVLADVSFIRLSTIIPSIVKLVQPHTHYLLLVKPQFEIEKTMVPDGGIVTDTQQQQVAVDMVREELLQAGIQVHSQTASAIKGASGNTEFFVYGSAKKK